MIFKVFWVHTGRYGLRFCENGSYMYYLPIGTNLGLNLAQEKIQNAYPCIKTFEGVCVTAVILAPGACGMGGPSRGSCHHFPGSRGSGGSGGEFQKRRSYRYTRDFVAHDLQRHFRVVHRRGGL